MTYMKRLTVIIFFLWVQLPAFSQSASGKQPSTVGIHFTLDDFSNHPSLGNLTKMDAGLSVSYLKGISNHLDWQFGVTGSFPDSLSKATIKSYIIPNVLLSSNEQASFKNTVLCF